MTKVNESIKFSRGLELKNRIVMAPMTTKMSFYDGVVTKDELDYYSLRSGELGAVITAAANVQEVGKGWEGELGAYDDKFIPGLSKLASVIKQSGTKAILQIFHGGRMTNSKVTRGKEVVSASAIPAERPGAETPKELRQEEILELIEAYKEATRRAMEAGFDGVELHGANTYLIQQFFSPHSNRREDEWGGSLEKRFKFIDELVDGVTELVDQSDRENFIVGYRFSPEEYEEPGIRFADTLYLVEQLANKPLDYLHISLNDYSRVSQSDDHQGKPMLAYIFEKIAGRVPLIGVGDVRSREDAEKVLKMANIVAVGRALLIDPNWTSKIMNNQEELVRKQVSHFDREKLGLTNGGWEFMENMMADRIK